MDIKEQKAKEYAESIPQFDDRKKYCIEDFCAGWDEALKSQWIKVEEKTPNAHEKVIVLFEQEGEIRIETDVYFGDDFYNYYRNYVWDFGGEKIIAWMPIPSFKDILQANKDVLKQ